MRRGRPRTNKEYSIKLVHPEFGVFYYQYSNLNSWNGVGTYFFTQNLSKVSTWKNIKYTEKKILKITETLESRKAKILLSFDDDLKNKFITNSKLIISRKKYYYPITNKIVSKTHINLSKNKIDELNKTLVNDSKSITKLIKKSKHVEKEFMSIFKKLENDINSYRKEHKFLESNKNSEDIYIDIVDASYNFRLLKLRTLKTVQNEDDVLPSEG
jgi:hypothetical protein